MCVCSLSSDLALPLTCGVCVPSLTSSSDVRVQSIVRLPNMVELDLSDNQVSPHILRRACLTCLKWSRRLDSHTFFIVIWPVLSVAVGVAALTHTHASSSCLWQVGKAAAIFPDLLQSHGVRLKKLGLSKAGLSDR